MLSDDSSPFFYTRCSCTYSLSRNSSPGFRHLHHSVRIKSAKTELMIEMKTSAVRSPAIINGTGELGCSYNNVLYVSPGEFVAENETTKITLFQFQPYLGQSTNWGHYPDGIAIQKCWFLRREKNQRKRRKPSSVKKRLIKSGERKKWKGGRNQRKRRKTSAVFTSRIDTRV